MKKILLLIFMLTGFGTAYSQSGSTLSGEITDSKNQPIAGATVSLLNTNYTTSTDKSGTYRFKNIPKGNYLLHATSLGFAGINKEVKISDQPTTLNFSLPEAANSLDEVVVTADKREEQVQKVPISVTTLSARDVQDYKIWNLKDITAISPNLYSANPGDNRNVTGIRGIATTSYDPAVTSYIDGVSQFSLDTYIPQIFDVERVEVLRGPQGTLYGRNAMGGVINVITKQPTNDFAGFAEIDEGNYAQQRYSVGVTGPLIKDKLFFGIAGLYTSLGGFYTNTYNNSKLDKQHSFLGNYYLTYLANERLSFTLNVKNYENRDNGPFALASSPQVALENPFKVDQNATTTMIDNTFNGSFNAKYTGRSFNLTSITTYQVRI